MWCHPQDLDEFEHSLSELTQYMLGKVSAMIASSAGSVKQLSRPIRTRHLNYGMK